MSYTEWIERERRIRIRLLLSAPSLMSDGILRVCGACGELCLCHEDRCPNCGSNDVSLQELPRRPDPATLAKSIRCMRRYKQLSADGS